MRRALRRGTVPLAVAVGVLLVIALGNSSATPSKHTNSASASDQLAQLQRHNDELVRAISRPAAAVEAIDPSQADHFAVLHDGAQKMPEDVRKMVAQSASGARFGLNPELAVPVTSIDGTWLVPGRETLCLWITDPVDGGGLVCHSTDEAIAEGLSASLVTHPGASDAAEHRFGVVPDGTPSVTLHKDDGTESRVSVRNNGWDSTIEGRVTTSLDDEAQ